MTEAKKVWHAAPWGVYVGTTREFKLTAMCGREVSNKDCMDWVGWNPTCPDCLAQDGSDGISSQKGGYQRPMTRTEAEATWEGHG